MVSQHWFRYWLGGVSQQAIAWANVDQVPCRHMASPGHNELTHAVRYQTYSQVTNNEYVLGFHCFNRRLLPIPWQISPPWLIDHLLLNRLNLNINKFWYQNGYDLIYIHQANITEKGKYIPISDRNVTFYGWVFRGAESFLRNNHAFSFFVISQHM